MDSTDLTAERIKLMGDVVGKLQDKIDDSLASIQRTMQIGVALLAAVFAAAFTRGQHGLLLAVPISLGLLLSYQMQVYSDMMAAAWQRQKLVKDLEIIVGSFTPPDIGLSRHPGANPSLTITKFIYFVILLSSAVSGYWVLTSLSLSIIAYVGYTFSIVLSISAVAWSIIENRASWDRCQRAADLGSIDIPYAAKMDEMMTTLGKPGSIWRQSRSFAKRSINLLTSRF